jgi:hypothetical protein
MTLPTGQKAKMLAGELYLATDPQLVTEDQRSAVSFPKPLCFLSMK